MSDIVEVLKAQLRKGYELGDGSVCLISARDLETFIAEIERLTRRVTKLGVLVEALADDLEAELRGHYGPVMNYPSEQRRFQRDMASVYEARHALEGKE